MTADASDPQRRRGGITSMQVALGRFLKDTGLRSRLRNVAIFKAWRDAIGIVLAQRARPVAFDNGVLEVSVQSSAHLQELVAFTGEQYRIKANRKLGSERIRKVVFRLERST